MVDNGVSIHAPWEGCDVPQYLRPHRREVSIHAPWEGCDSQGGQSYTFSSVSIHAPWEGCDKILHLRCKIPPSFNSRTLGRVRRRRWRGSRLALTFQFTHPGKGATQGRATPTRAYEMFQFTHPGKGATMLQERRCSGLRVSIHAPWEGCDYAKSAYCLSG